MKVLYTSANGVPLYDIESSVPFVNDVIAFVKSNRLDAEITENKNTIHAVICFENCAVLTGLKACIAQADAFYILAESNRIVLHLDAAFAPEKPSRL